MAKVSQATLLFVLIILVSLAREHVAMLQVGFYQGKCGHMNVEQVVFDVIAVEVAKDTSILGPLLRMTFHDCFVRGCDASILLDGPNTEKTAEPNGSLRGFEVIDAVKAALEKLCPGVVSCADIIAITGRVSVVLAKGRWYEVETGRRDGVISLATEANSTLPGAAIPVSDAVQEFAAKGIDIDDFILLLGGHTIGVAHCFQFQDRLYNFNGSSGTTDPTMNHGLVKKLKRTCPENGDETNTTYLDQSSARSANLMGNGYFYAIRRRKGVLQIDQDIALHTSTKAIVNKYASNNALFNVKFGEAMVKMGRIGVLTGTLGQVRKSCRSVN